MQLITISRSAVLKRLDRYMRRVDGEQLHTSRNETTLQEFGRHYTTDLHGGYVCAKYVEPETWARELGILRSYETVAR